MSPLWRNRLVVALSPGAVSCELQPRGWPPRPPRRTLLTCEPPADGPPWRAAVDALREALPQIAACRTDVEIVLSNHFVRYLVVPWHDTLADRGERDALARHLFRQTYADLADGWHVRLGGAAWGRAALACAVDSELQRALGSLGEASAVRLTRLRPLLMVAFNAFLPQLGDDACLCVLEPGRLCCGHFAGGQWRRVHSVRLPGPVDAEALIERQRCVLGVDPGAAVCLFDAADPWAAGREGAPHQRLKPSPRPPDPAALLFAQAA